MRHFALAIPLVALLSACSAGVNPGGGGAGGASGGSGPGAGGGAACDTCTLGSYTPCNADGTPGTPVACPAACAPKLGCVECVPGSNQCVGNEIHACSADGHLNGPLVQTCDVSAGMTCSNGACKTGCEIAADKPSNVGCEFWAVDLDQQDALNDPASAPWGITLSNAGASNANVTIEINEAPVGSPAQLSTVKQLTVPAGSLQSIILPTRELDCGAMPNDYNAPGTCLSSRAFRITSSSPIVVYQFNVFQNAYSNDASLLLPTNALGQVYRVIGWGAGHPVKVFNIIDRSYVTIVGTQPDTDVTVKPSWRIKGNPPIAATAAGGLITVKLQPFDVLNLETDDGTLQDDPKTIADLSGTGISSTKPVAVFSGTESTGAPGAFMTPTPPNWMSGDTCCLDHLEDQMFPAESVGTHYVITRSPVRSTSSFKEPDVIRFVGVAETSHVTTSLPAPYDSFTLAPGEVKTTWTQDDFVAAGDKPFLIGQILVSNEYVDGPYIGDPSLTVYPPVEQYRTEYLIPSPDSWTETWVVIAEEPGTTVLLDGMMTANCPTAPSGMVNGKMYQSRKCPLGAGGHSLTGDKPFGIVTYGYGSAGSYALAGGADVKHIYNPPPVN